MIIVLFVPLMFDYVMCKLINLIRFYTKLRLERDPR